MNRDYVTCATALCTGNLVDTMMVMVTAPVLELIHRGPRFLRSLMRLARCALLSLLEEFFLMRNIRAKANCEYYDAPIMLDSRASAVGRWPRRTAATGHPPRPRPPRRRSRRPHRVRSPSNMSRLSEKRARGLARANARAARCADDASPSGGGGAAAPSPAGGGGGGAAAGTAPTQGPQTVSRTSATAPPSSDARSGARTVGPCLARYFSRRRRVPPARQQPSASGRAERGSGASRGRARAASRAVVASSRRARPLRRGAAARTAHPRRPPSGLAGSRAPRPCAPSPSRPA